MWCGPSRGQFSRALGSSAPSPRDPQAGETDRLGEPPPPAFETRTAPCETRVHFRTVAHFFVGLEVHLQDGLVHHAEDRLVRLDRTFGRAGHRIPGVSSMPPRCQTFPLPPPRRR